MAAFNVTVHNSSPLISYAAAWFDTPAGDAYVANYTNSGFHTTNVSGAAVTFKFNGTGVWFYGAHRPGYGGYSLSVDGNTVGSGSAASSNPLFDQVLGGSANLSVGEHTAILTNTGGGAIDLDSLIFQTQIGYEDQQVSQMTIDDTNSTISYIPSGSDWQVAINPLFANGSTHYTNASSAQATLSFSGGAIAVYGGVSFDHGDYTVSLDGQTQQLNGANGQARIYHPKSLLYFSNNLGNGTHNLTVSLSSKGYFDLDQIVVYQATGGKEKSGDPSSGGMEMKPSGLHIDASNGNNAADGVAAHSKPIPNTVIAGIVAASILGLVSVLVIIVFLVSQCRRRRALSKQLSQPSNNADSPVLPIQDPDLEAGPPVFEEKKIDVELNRSTSRFTVKSFASRWSQASFAGAPAPHDLDVPPIPAVPRLPGLPTAPKLSLTTEAPNLRRTPSTFSASTGSATLHSAGDGDSVLDDYYYRHSTASTKPGSVNSVAPLRPARPPGLNLGELGPSFDHVPL